MSVLWDLDDDPNGDVEHIAQHGLTKKDVEHVLFNWTKESTSRSTGRPLVFGYAPDGEYIVVVFELVDQETVYPITAYPVEEN